jgi:hypothetical protein
MITTISFTTIIEWVVAAYVLGLLTGFFLSIYLHHKP